MKTPLGRDSRGTGVLLIRAEVDAVTRWAQRGLVAVHVVDAHGWSAVLPAERTSRVEAPYDGAVAMLAGRPIGVRLRPAVGLFAVDGRAVVTVHPPGWRSLQRWLVWDPGRGVVRTPNLPPARPRDLAGMGDTAPTTSTILDALRRRSGTPIGWLTDLAEAVGLPGAALLHGVGSSTPVVEPRPTAVRSFRSMRLEEESPHRADPATDAGDESATGAPSDGSP